MVTRIPFNVTLLDDGLVEGDEDFQVRLQIVTMGVDAELVPDDVAPVKILDDDSKSGWQYLHCSCFSPIFMTLHTLWSEIELAFPVKHSSTLTEHS